MQTISVENLQSVQEYSTHLRMEHWLQAEVFTWQWWLMVVVWLTVLFVWWKLADKRRIMEIMLYGAIASYIITACDGIGTELGAWGYAYKVIPLFNRLMVVDCGTLSGIYMITYQYLNTWKSFCIGHIALAFLLAFVIEPLVQLSGVYIPYHWHSMYSFPIYFTIPILLRFCILRIKNLQHG